jgi:hydroxypyruvate reductase
MGWEGATKELALGAALSIHGVPDILCAAYASDGGDGPSDAAGAVIDGSTIARAKVAGHDAHAAFGAQRQLSFFCSYR